MFNMNRQSSTIKGITVFLAITLITTSVFSQMSRDVELTIETDQPQYYPGEEVTVFGQLTENGSGVPMSPVCANITDPDELLIFGICGITTSEGNYTFSHTLESDAILGVYGVEVHSFEFDISVTTTVEAVSMTVDVDAHGPYEGTVGEAVSFFGDATGGKLPYTWHWNFGDDETADEQNPSHIYETPGEYIATLTVSDNDSAQGNDTADVTINLQENSPPSDPTIDGQTNGTAGEEYDYTFSAVDPDGDEVYFWIEWFDGCPGVEWVGPYTSGEEVIFTNTWPERGSYTIRAKAKDIHDAESNWSALEVQMPKNQHQFNGLIQKLLNWFSWEFPLIKILLRLS